MAEEDDKISADDWAAAMAEQQTEPAGDSAADDWGAALAEQAASDAAAQSDVKPASQLFQPLTQEQIAAPPGNLEMVLDIPVNLTVEQVLITAGTQQTIMLEPP